MSGGHSSMGRRENFLIPVERRIRLHGLDTQAALTFTATISISYQTESKGEIATKGQLAAPANRRLLHNHPL
eukprot:scaffold330365_cov27-Prasinocladus_malaysianus.AAC.1